MSSDRTVETRATRSAHWSHLAIGVVAACATSGDGQPQFRVTRAAVFAQGATVSMFGIFRNGRLSPEAWDSFAAELSLPFSQKTCEAAYTKDLADTKPELMSAVDDCAKENGVSDELLDRLAPLARGDTIMVIAMTGEFARPVADAGAGKVSKPATTQAPSGQGGYGGPGGGPGGGRGMGRGGGGGSGRSGFGGRGLPHAPSDHAKPERGVWEISASFFSVSLHHTVAEVTMTYSGQDLEAALKAFVGRLGVEMPGVPCRGWDWNARVDVAALRRMLVP